MSPADEYPGPQRWCPTCQKAHPLGFCAIETGGDMSQDLAPPERIYLEPRESDPDTGRLWCVDQIEEDWTEYIRADLAVSGIGRTSGGNSQPLTKPVPDAVTLTDPMEYLEHGPEEVVDYVCGYCGEPKRDHPIDRDNLKCPGAGIAGWHLPEALQPDPEAERVQQALREATDDR